MSVWKFIKDKVIDKRAGSEWFWTVDKNGLPHAEGFRFRIVY